MKDFILIGADVHDAKIIMRYSMGSRKSRPISCANTSAGRAIFIQKVLAWADGDAHRVRVMYESGPHWFTFYDDLAEADIRCTVLPAHHLDRSVHARANKTDSKDAERLLKRLRNELLAGDEAPAVWVPDWQTRGDRELIIRRMSLGKRVGQIKTQLNSIVRKYGVELEYFGPTRWSQAYRAALEKACKEQMPTLSAVSVSSMLKELAWVEHERKSFDKGLAYLAEATRHRAAVQEMTQVAGVGLLTALAIVTTLGDPYRFKNRRKVASYVGLAPRTHESGACDDRKGHITRQGPPHLRKLLNQAVNSSLRVNADAQMRRDRIAKGTQYRKKATVALMRLLLIKLWNIAKRHAWPDTSTLGKRIRC